MSWMWWHTPVISGTWGPRAGGLQVSLDNLMRLYLNIKNKKDWGCSSVVECSVLKIKIIWKGKKSEIIKILQKKELGGGSCPSRFQDLL